MATGRGASEAYYDANPMQSWDWDKWDEYDSAIDIGFHQRPVFFTPLMNYVQMPNGADTYYTGNELLRGHTNYRHNCSPVAKSTAEKSPLNTGKVLARITRGKQAKAVQPQRLSEGMPYQMMLGAVRQSELRV